MEKERQKIVIVRLSALGDIINSVIVAKFIKLHMPQSRLEWVVDEIDVVHTVSIKKNKSLPLLLKEIKKLRTLGNFDLVIDMQSAIVSRLIKSHRGRGFTFNFSVSNLYGTYQ